MKKLLIIIGVVAMLAGVGTTLSAKSGTYTTPNCGASAIVKCGTFNQTQLNNGLSKDVKAVYAKYNVDTNLAAAKSGTLKANGDVVVSGKVVATGAQSIGRNAKSGATTVTIGGKKYHTHSAKSAFLGYDTPVFVSFNKDGSFRSAIAKVCGNPIIAKPTPVPYYNCEDINATKVSRTSFKFATAVTAKNGATHKSTTYVVRNSAGKIVQNSTSTTFNTATAGTYTVEATASFTANGKVVQDTSPRCKISFTVAPEPVVNIKVCDLTTKKIITIDQKKFDAKKHSKNLDDCKPPVMIKVCDLTTKKVISIDTKKFDSKKHSKNLEDCKPPVMIKACDVTTKKIVTIDQKKFDAKKHSKNLDDCKPPVMIQVCKLDTKMIIMINEKDFDVKKHSKNLKDCVIINYIKVCDLATKKVISISDKLFDTKKHSKNLNDCKEVVVKIQVCELDTKKIITIDEKNFDNKKHSKDLKDCEVVNKIQVCELDTKKVITINEKDFDVKKHSKDLDDCKPPVMIEVCVIDTKKVISIDEKDFDSATQSKDLNDCKEVPPVTPPTEMCEVPGKEHMPKDSADCVETPVTELPTTGMGDFMPVLGAGSLIAAIGYYVASRRLI